MPLARMLSAVGLIRPSRRPGFCPACRLFRTGDGSQEIAAPVVIGLAFLVVAAVGWALTIDRLTWMDDMAMGLGRLDEFVPTWTMMIAAMMLPSAIPVVLEFARDAEGRPGWQAATAVLGATYVGVWLAFGVACYAAYIALGMPWANQELVGGAALAAAGVYGLTPLRRASEAACRERCALHAPLPFNRMRSAIVVGVRYGARCIGSSVGLMVAMVLIGMSNLAWMILLTAAVLAYKIAPTPSLRCVLTLSGALVGFGILYAIG